MAEYIEREAFFRFLTEQKDKETGAYSKGRNAGLDVARSALHNREITPAADVVERKRGEWAIDKEDLEWGNALKRRYCTNCKKRPHFDKEKRVFVLTDFCPHCGCDMRGEKHETD